MTNTPPPRSTSLEDLLDRVQRTTIAYFWEGAHPVSGLAYRRRLTWGDARNDLVSIGGSGFSFLAIIVAVNRGWIEPESSQRVFGRLFAADN